MIKKYHKWNDRRHASKTKPLKYLVVEFALFVLVSWIAFLLTPLWIATIVIVASLYFFLTNSLKRYHKVLERQQFYEEEK